VEARVLRRRVVALVLAGMVVLAVDRPGRAETLDRAPACGSPRESCGRLFVIAVGYDGVSPPYVSRYAESDAEKLARRLALERATAGSSRTGESERRALLTGSAEGAVADSAFAAARAGFALSDSSFRAAEVALLVGQDATLAAVEAAFARVIARARRDDAFVFFFGGISRAVGDSVTGDHILHLAGGRFTEDSSLRAHGLSSDQLGYWMDNILAERQLAVLEAGEGREVLGNFVAGTFARDPLVSRLVTRQRLILGPRGYGRESQSGGFLVHAIVRSPEPLLAIFDRSAHVVGVLAASLRGLLPDEDYIRLFDERDFRDAYAAIAARSAPRTRGTVPAAPVARPALRIGRNVALVVGTNRYEASSWPRLVNPIVDAEAVASTLAGGFGFDTTVLRDPTRDELLTALVTLAERTYEARDQLVVFIAGHGQYDELLRMGHLVMRDSRALSEDRFKRSYISHGELAQYLEAIPVGHILLVLDACFGGAFADDVAAGSRAGDEYDDADLGAFVERKLQFRSRLYLTSGATEYVSDGRPGQHSPFARRLLATLRDADAAGRPLTISAIRAGVEAAQPGPRSGEFGRSEPGGDVLLIPLRRQR
jgi:hypothetical protein